MDEFIGIVKLFAGTFAPVGWLPCDGRLLPISQYDTIYTLLGTTYGGDGVSTFGLPDLRSVVPVGAGRTYQAGNIGGSDTVTLTISTMPDHQHVAMLNANPVNGTSNVPTGNVLAQSFGSIVGSTDTLESTAYAPTTAGTPVPMGPGAIGNVSMSGGGQPHNNMQPYLGMIYCICVEGIWPSQS